MKLLGLLAGIGCVLAFVGMYATSANATAVRTREFGVRLALGADPASLFRLVLRTMGSIAVVGAVVGLAGAAVVSRLLASRLYGVEAADPATWLLGIAALGLLLFVATLGPALRASLVDPLDALRSER